ncbi:MAG: YbaN family protein [Oscillospiraceae bacterium]|nr:YbaN family protein [Oscillospiraceae bacterium]
MTIKKLLLIILGFSSLALGVVGVLIPVLPTTPFVLLSAACFSASSKRFDDWLRRNRLFGPYIENYRTKQGISKLRKAATLTFLWTGLLVSIIIVRTPVIFVVLSIVGIGVTIHILMIKTKK